MQPIAKAPPQSSTIRYGHGSLAYSSIWGNFVYSAEKHIANIFSGWIFCNRKWIRSQLRRRHYSLLSLELVVFSAKTRRSNVGNLYFMWIKFNREKSIEGSVTYVGLVKSRGAEPMYECSWRIFVIAEVRLRTTILNKLNKKHSHPKISEIQASTSESSNHINSDC